MARAYRSPIWLRRRPSHPTSPRAFGCSVKTAPRLNKAAFVTPLSLAPWPRGDAVPDSDVDVLVDFERRDAIDLFGFAALRARLERLLGRNVDLVSRRALDPVRDRVLLDEAVMAF